MEIIEIEKYIECNFIVKKSEIPVSIGLGLLPEKEELDHNGIKKDFYPYLGFDGIFESTKEATEALWEDFLKFANGKEGFVCFWRVKPKILECQDFDDNKKKFAGRMRLTLVAN